MMDSNHVDQAERSSPETFSDSSLPPESPPHGISGDPVVHPRVGDEYQVEIPSVMSKCELTQPMNQAESQGIVDSSHFFFTGLPIPVMWVRNEANLIKTERLEYVDHSHKVYTNGLVEPEVDPPDRTPVNNGNWLVPGHPTEPWNDFEADCFLLGLYLLGKNLLQLERFVGSKSLGQILTYYYGQFYASAAYNRWSECRKMRSRKCVIGHKFFTGYRQQELFSRISPRISEESKTKLVEASRAFAETRMSLDEYVLTLKAVVGIRDLVDAVGIGKGKEDLTTMVFEGPKNNQIIPHRPEVPSGKAWSSLTCAEITKYLTGDFRLSKAKSNDLFWEAVWPRLLDRGWNSEQPRGECYKGSKHLVFLMPGIKKFSRRKLSKGEHYFDCVSDVLKKVASEPELIRLGTDEATPSSSRGENGWATEVKTDDDQESSDHERHCYLKPRVSVGLSDSTKFTVVDTSLVNEDNPYKVSELMSLPAEAERSFVLSSGMRKTETELQADANVLSNGLQSSSFPAHSRGSSSDNVGSQSDPGGKLNCLSNPRGSCLPMNHKSRTIKHQFSRRVKPDLSSCAGPATKRRRLASSADTDVTFVSSLPANKRNATLRILGPKLSQTDVNSESTAIHTEKSDQDQDSSMGNHVEFYRFSENGNMSTAQHAIDLNLPQVPTEVERDRKVRQKEKVSSSIQNSDVEKTRRFDSGKEKRCYVKKQRPSDLKTPTSSDAETPKHLFAEKQINSEDTIGPSDSIEPRMSSSSREPLSIVLASNQQPQRHFVAENPKSFVAELQKNSEDPVGVSDNIDPTVSSASREPVSIVVESDQHPGIHFIAEKTKQFVAEMQKNYEHFVGPSVYIEPTLSSASREPLSIAVESGQQPGRHLVAEKQINCVEAVGPYEIMEPQVISTSREPSKRAKKHDQQPIRQSTRSRPLTTKALEALEIGLLSPVRTYKKRSPSMPQDQKPKRARQLRNKSPMFSDDMVFGSAEETFNGNTDMVG